MHISKFIPAFLAVTMLSGCATVFDGGSHSMNVQPSQGKDVKIEVTGENGVQQVQIPSVVNVPRGKQDLYIAVKDECYNSTTQVVQSDITLAFFGNIFFSIFGLTGTTVDMSNGNAWTYDDNVVVATTPNGKCADDTK